MSSKNRLAVACLVAVIVAMFVTLVMAQRTVPGVYPCSLVGTCQAAYSVRRRVVATYTGNLFQLSKTGGTTQNVGQNANGTVNSATINTFCGSNNANTCKYHIIYDQSSNGNDLTCTKATVGFVSTTCTVFTDDVPFTYVGSWGSAPVPSVTGANSGSFFNTLVPTGTPTGNANISVSIVGNDSNVAASTSHYAIDFGIFHATNLADTDLTNFGATLRSNIGGTGEFRYFGLDLETTSIETIYGPSAGANNYVSPSTDTLSNVGDFVGVATYATSGTAITVDFNNGQRTYTDTISTPNWGNGATAQIRLMAGGDATLTPGIWYEGLIYAATLTAGQRQLIETNQQEFYQITPLPSCLNSPGRASNAVELIGRGNVTAAYGLRQMDPHYAGPIVGLYNTSSTSYKLIGTKAGTCDIDTATIATFCATGTCYVYELFNQVFPAGHKDAFTTNITDKSLLFISGAAPPTTTAPSITQNCLNTTLPCMNFVGSNNARLLIRTNEPVTRPYTVIAVAEKTAGATYAAIWADDLSGAMYYGAGPSASTINFYADASHFEQITGLTNSTWYAMAGMVPAGNTTITACANGTCSNATGQTTADIASAQWIIGRGNNSNLFTGNVVEIIHVNGTAISTGTAASISTEQRAYWSF